MDIKEDARNFLVSRRAKITPEQVGLPRLGGRRVPGLRREEVAKLAQVSIDYYTRLERGNIRGASDDVLMSVAQALLLNEEEKEYLFTLARARQRTDSELGRRSSSLSVRASVQNILDSMSMPAIVHNAQQDLIATNPMGRALYAPLFDGGATPNIARFIFLEPQARDYYVDWEQACRIEASTMRLESGRDPFNSSLTALIYELSERSAEFREHWASQDVHQHRNGIKSFRHPAIGLVEVAFDVFEMPGEAGLTIVSYSPPPGTDTAQKFDLLTP